MRRWVLNSVETLCAFALMACAGGRARRVTAPSPRDVLSEVSRRSAVPETELTERLNHCDADQLNTYFCAFRDFVAADLLLERTTAEQVRLHPECKESIERTTHALREARDSGCAKSAADEYGGGSMEQTAQVICGASATRPFVDQVGAVNSCPDSAGKKN